MPWVARYPWGGIQSQSGEVVPPDWMSNTPEFARTGGWVWEQPVGTPRPDLAPSPPLVPSPQPPPYPPAPPPQPSPAPVDGGTPTERASRLLAGALRGNPFLQASGLARLESGRAPLLSEIQSPLWGVTSPTTQQALMGLYQAMGLRPEDVQHAFSMWKIPQLGW